MSGDPDEFVEVVLTREQREFVVDALWQWEAPAYPTEELAVAMGFAGLEGLRADLAGLRSAVELGERLTRRDWTRIIAASEICFASVAFGVSGEWDSVIGENHETGYRKLREVQTVVVGAGAITFLGTNDAHHKHMKFGRYRDSDA